MTTTLNRRSLAAAAAAAAFVSMPLAAGAQETLKIGGIGSLSGGGTAWGLAIKRGTELAIDEMNAKGGIKAGGKTYKLEHVMLDDQYTATGGKTAAERLVFQDKVQFIVGPIGSPAVISTVNVMYEAMEKGSQKILLLANGFSIPILKNKWNSPLNFRVTNTNREFVKPAVAWTLKRHPEVKKVGSLSPNDAVGQFVTPVIKAGYEAHKVEFLDEVYERGTKEFTPFLLRLMAKGMQLLDLASTAPGEAGLVVKQVRQAGFKGPIIQIGGPGVDEIIAVAGDLAEGFMSYDMYHFEDPKNKWFVDIYRKKYGEGIINSQTPFFFNATRNLFEAMRRADSVDPEKVRDALDKMDGYDAGVLGPITWGGLKEYGVKRQQLLPFLMVQVKDKKIVVLDTLQPIDE